MVIHKIGDEVVIKGNEVISHGFSPGTVCKIERLYSIYKGHHAYELTHVDLRGKHYQIVSVKDFMPLNVSSNEEGLRCLKENPPW